jgi:hypothetical protein
MDFAQRAVEETDEQFLQELDFSPASVERIEWLASEFDQHPEHWLSMEERARFAVLWGAYIGEVLRRHCGGKWVMVGGTAALRAGGFTLFPLTKVEKRLTEGAEHNLVGYFAVCADLIKAEPDAADVTRDVNARHHL